MDNKKYEKLMDLVINEQHEKASQLFHEIVVESSRKIYESIMDEEMLADEMYDEGMHGKVGNMIDEISAEESGVHEAEEDDVDVEMDASVDDEGDVDLDVDAMDSDGDEMDMDVSLDSDAEGTVSKAEVRDLKDDVQSILDDLDAILASAGDEGLEDEEGLESLEDEDMEDLEDEEDEFEDEEDKEEAMMEAVKLERVKGLYDGHIGGDDGVQKRSPVPQNSGKAGMDGKPVKFSGDHEAVPNGPKAPSNYGTKGEKEVAGAGSFGNVPGQKGKKLSAAPKPTTSQASGVNNKSLFRGK